MRTAKSQMLARNRGRMTSRCTPSSSKTSLLHKLHKVINKAGIPSPEWRTKWAAHLRRIESKEHWRIRRTISTGSSLRTSTTTTCTTNCASHWCRNVWTDSMEPYSLMDRQPLARPIRCLETLLIKAFLCFQLKISSNTSMKIKTQEMCRYGLAIINF